VETVFESLKKTRSVADSVLSSGAFGVFSVKPRQNRDWPAIRAPVKK